MDGVCAWVTRSSKRCHSISTRLGLGLALSLAASQAATVHVAGQSPSQSVEDINRVLLSRGIRTVDLRTEVIVSWNKVAHDIAYAEDQFLTFKGQRAMAMMHLAMHDALNAILPVYESYTFRGAGGLADPVAAAAQAAHDVLLSQYAAQQTALSDERGRWLAHVPDGTPRERGAALGSAAAAAVLTAREGDGWNSPGTYEFGEGPGRYQTTPPWDGFVAHPGFRFAKPFVLKYPHQFRPAPPPPLSTKTYARALSEVRDYGAVDSARRTDDQSAYAIWWMEFAEGSVNRLARQLTRDRGLHLWPAARLFALIGVALYDAYVATWDAKYVYDHWRPYTAVRNADADHNADTLYDHVRAKTIATTNKRVLT
jgi:hypothetical protein